MSKSNEIITVEYAVEDWVSILQGINDLNELAVSNMDLVDMNPISMAIHFANNLNKQVIKVLRDNS